MNLFAILALIVGLVGGLYFTVKYPGRMVGVSILFLTVIHAALMVANA